MTQAHKTVLLASRGSKHFAAPSQKNSQVELGSSKKANNKALDSQGNYLQITPNNGSQNLELRESYPANTTGCFQNSEITSSHL